jgi:hypothetical protein
LCRSKIPPPARVPAKRSLILRSIRALISTPPARCWIAADLDGQRSRSRLCSFSRKRNFARGRAEATTTAQLARLFHSIAGTREGEMGTGLRDRHQHVREIRARSVQLASAVRFVSGPASILRHWRQQAIARALHRPRARAPGLNRRRGRYRARKHDRRLRGSCARSARRGEP